MPLKHPFFISCFNIPPLSFNDIANAAILSARTREELQQKCDQRHHGAVSNSSLNYYFPSPIYKLLYGLSTVVHRDFDRTSRDVSSSSSFKCNWYVDKHDHWFRQEISGAAMATSFEGWSTRKHRIWWHVSQTNPTISKL